MFLHIFAAIIAFGPTFVFPVIGPMVAKEPMHGNFWLRAVELIERRLIIPFALTMPFSGIGLIVTRHIDVLKTQWLITAIGFYVLALALAIGHQLPATLKLIHLTDGMRAGGPGAAMAGPPPEFAGLLRRVQIVGGVLTLILLVIGGLMIFGKEGGHTAITG
jgi:hypothetical protein